MAGSETRVAATHVYSAPLGGPAARPGLAPRPWPGLAPGPCAGLAAGPGATGTGAASAAAETRHAAASSSASAQHAVPGCKISLVLCETAYGHSAATPLELTCGEDKHATHESAHFSWLGCAESMSLVYTSKISVYTPALKLEDLIQLLLARACFHPGASGHVDNGGLRQAAAQAPSAAPAAHAPRAAKSCRSRTGLCATARTALCGLQQWVSRVRVPD